MGDLSTMPSPMLPTPSTMLLLTPSTMLPSITQLLLTRQLPSTTQLPLTNPLPSTTQLLLTISLLPSTTQLPLTSPPLSTSPLPLSTNPLLFTWVPPTSPLTQLLLTMSPLMMAQLSINMVMLSLMTTLAPTLLNLRTVMVMLPPESTAWHFPMAVPKSSPTLSVMLTLGMLLMSHTKVRLSMLLSSTRSLLLTTPKKDIY